jgi:ribosomal protein S6--L-glutamate ligase
MKFAILSRNRNLHSIRRLLTEARKAGVSCDIINPLDCQLVVEGKQSQILVGGKPLQSYDAILPRIGASITDYGLAVVRQFESLGMKVVNPSQAIADSRDKLRCLQILSADDIRVPATVLARSHRGIRTALDRLGGMPVVLKLLQGTQGVGVMIVHSPVSLGSVVDTLQGLDRDVLLQEFIREGAGRDYRVFVVGQEVIATMLRTAPEGEFRTNIHRGGQGHPVELSKEYQKLAVHAARRLGLEIAGVDMMIDRTGALILEVNSSPGFEGIEKATRLNVAGAMIRHMIRLAGGGRKKKGAVKKTTPRSKSRSTTKKKIQRKPSRE